MQISFYLAVRTSLRMFQILKKKQKTKQKKPNIWRKTRLSKRQAHYTLGAT
jgi:hypothetical protein